MHGKILELKELIEYAKEYPLPKIDAKFDPDHYTRTIISKTEYLEIVVICFDKGQSSSIHHHQGSSCTIRLVDGKLLETNFDENDGDFSYRGHHYLLPGDISGLDGSAIHQIANMTDKSILINFYSPPFK